MINSYNGQVSSEVLDVINDDVAQIIDDNNEKVKKRNTKKMVPIVPPNAGE